MENKSTESVFSPVYDKEKVKDIECGDLYELLSICTNEELDPLVKNITFKKTNSIESNEIYKQHFPNHTMYYWTIGDEICRYGGNSIRNVFRGGAGPAYNEIVIDVCKKLKIPFDPGNTVKNESNMLNLYLERQWEALSQEEQETIIAQARNDASKQAFNPSTIIKQGGAFLLGRMVLGSTMVGIGLLAFSFTEPAYKVLIPCLLHIAYLRRKFLDRVETATNALSKSVSNTTNPNPSWVPATIRSNSLVVGTLENEPLLSLAWISEPEGLKPYPIDSFHEDISRLNPLLQAVPSLATTSEVATTKYMEVVINGPLMKAKGGNGFRCMTPGPGGKGIGEHGLLLEPSRLSNIVNASALFQVASVAVAQKHLADINEKLSEIKACVDRIHDFQKNERRSILTGSIHYFEQVAQAVLAGELSDSVRNQIEHHEMGLLRVQEHLMEDIRHESHEIINVKDKGTFGSKGMQDAIRKHQNILNDLYQQLLLCIRARACGWQLLVAFPGEERLKNTRKRNIEKSLGALTEGGDLLKQTDMFMRQKVKDLSSVWNNPMTINERKLSLLEWNDTLLVSIKSCKKQIERDIRAAEMVMSDRQQPVSMIFKVERNQIIGVCSV